MNLGTPVSRARRNIGFETAARDAATWLTPLAAAIVAVLLWPSPAAWAQPATPPAPGGGTAPAEPATTPPVLPKLSDATAYVTRAAGLLAKGQTEAAIADFTA